MINEKNDLNRKLTAEEWEKIEKHGENSDVIIEDIDNLFDKAITQNEQSTKNLPASLP